MLRSTHRAGAQGRSETMSFHSPILIYGDGHTEGFEAAPAAAGGKQIPADCRPCLKQANPWDDYLDPKATGHGWRRFDHPGWK